MPPCRRPRRSRKAEPAPAACVPGRCRRGAEQSRAARTKRPPGASIIGSDDGWTRHGARRRGRRHRRADPGHRAAGDRPAARRRAARRRVQAADQAKTASEAVAALDRRVSAVEMITQNLPAQVHGRRPRRPGRRNCRRRWARWRRRATSRRSKTSSRRSPTRSTRCRRRRHPGRSGGAGRPRGAAGGRWRRRRAAAVPSAGGGGGAQPAASTRRRRASRRSATGSRRSKQKLAAGPSRQHARRPRHRRGGAPPGGGRGRAVRHRPRPCRGARPAGRRCRRAQALRRQGRGDQGGAGGPVRPTSAMRSSARRPRPTPMPASSSGCLAGVGSLVTVRPTGPVAGNDPAAIVSRMQAAVDAGDLATALSERDGLPAAGKDASADWAAAAESRVTVDGLIARIAAVHRSRPAGTDRHDPRPPLCRRRVPARRGLRLAGGAAGRAADQLAGLRDPHLGDGGGGRRGDRCSR